jgi:hypothetical protein
MMDYWREVENQKDTPRDKSIRLGRSWQMLGVITSLHVSNV